MKRAWLVVFLCVLIASARAADLPGSKDPPGFKRYEGSQIIHYFQRGYSEYKLDRDGGWDKTETAEGAVTRVVYLVPPGAHTALEIFRNYEQMLSEAGLQQTFELKSDALKVLTSYFFQRFFFGGLENYDSGNNSSLYKYTSKGTNPNYVTYKGTKDGQDLTVAVLVGEVEDGFDWIESDPKNPVKIDKGQVVAAIDVVAAKAVENKMVFVKAADMADALATKGSVDLYGIYFDVDKTDIKPDSAKTLDEVASLMKIDRSLKLEISGHTDNTGGADHNLKLSEGRAQAVVDALVKSYGIDAGRLQAKGYGDTKPVATNDTDDGRAKNRRVELKKL